MRIRNVVAFCWSHTLTALSTPLNLHAHTLHIQDEDGSELRALVATFKNMTGLWDIDPEDSAWYHLEQRDKNDPGLVVPMGSICYRYTMCVGVYCV